MSDRPFNPTYSLRGLTAQAQAGFLGAIPNVTLGLAGMLGHGWSARTNQAIQQRINDTLEVRDPNWREDPTGFLARVIGGAVPVPVAPGASPFATAGGRVLEAITPVTISSSARTLPINIGVQGAIGAGVQELVDVEQRGRAAIAGETPLNLDNSGEIPLQLTPSDAPLAVRPPPPQPRHATWAGPIIDYVLPAAAVGGLGLAGWSAARALRAGSAADAAMDGSVIRPGLQRNPEVQQLNTPQQLQQSVISDRVGAERALNEAVDAGNLHRAVADDVLGRIQTQLAESPKNDQISEWARTGRNPITGTQVRPLYDFELEVAALKRTNPDSVARAMDALAAGTEFDVRNVNMREGRWMPGARGEPARVTLHDKNMADLQRMMADGQADPVAARIISEYRTSTSAMLLEMFNMGLKNADDLSRMARDNPNYMHWIFSEEQVVRDPSGMRILTTGSENNNPINPRVHGHEAGALRAQDPMISLNEAWRKVMALGLENNARLAFANAIMPHVKAARQANPTAPRLVRGIKVRDNDKTPAGWVPVHYYEGGKRKAIEVAPSVAEVLQSYPRATVPLISAATRMFRNMTTGPIAAVLGSVQAPVSAAMAAMATTVNRAPGTKAGLIDAGVQRASRGRFGMRADPTFLGQTAYAAVADLSAEGSRAIASALRNSELNNGLMARWLGPADLRKLMQSAQKAYDDSVLARMREQGSAGTGLARDPEQSRTLAVQNQALTPDYASLAQQRTHAGGIDAVRAAAEHYGARITPVTAQRTWQLFTTALDIVSSAAASAYVRQNPHVHGMSQKALHGMARRIAGDPAEMGSSRLAQATYSMIPYSNVAVQSTAAYLRGFRNHPIAAASGIAAAVVLPQMAQLASAIIADEWNLENGKPPEHVMWLLNQNASGQSHDLRIMIPGVPPQNGMRIPTDLSLAPLSAAMNNLLLGAVVRNYDQFWTPEMAGVRSALTDFMSDRTDRGVLAGIQSMSPVNTPPPLLTAAFRVGLDVDIANAARFGEPSALVRRDMGAQGYTREDLYGDPAARFVSDLAQTLFGAAGTSALELYRTGVLSSRASNPDVVGALGDQYRLNTAGTMRIAPPLLQPDRQLAQRDAVGDIVAKKLEGLDRVRNGIADVTRPGTVGSGVGINMPDGVGRPNVPPEMQQVLLVANSTKAALAKLQQLRAGEQAQLTSIDSDPERRNNPVASREARNRVVQNIRNYNREMYNIIEQNETMLSRQTGRAVRFETLDPNRGLDQFQPYSPTR